MPERILSDFSESRQDYDQGTKDEMEISVHFFALNKIRTGLLDPSQKQRENSKGDKIDFLLVLKREKS